MPHEPKITLDNTGCGRRYAQGGERVSNAILGGELRFRLGSGSVVGRGRAARDLNVVAGAAFECGDFSGILLARFPNFLGADK